MNKLLYSTLFALIVLSACKKDKDEVKPTDSTENTWQFTAAGHTYSGNFVSAVFTDIIGGNMRLDGTLKSKTTDTVFTLTVQFDGNKLDTGTYSTENAGTNFQMLKANGDVIYAANAISTPPVLSIKVSAYDSTTHIVSGVFSGDSYNFDGATVPVTGGTFKAKVSQ